MKDLWKKSSKIEDIHIDEEPSMVPSRSGEELHKLVSEKELKIGFWDQLVLDQRTSRVTAQKLGDITNAIVEKQKSEIKQKLMLDLDLQKKRAAKDYMDMVGELNKVIVEKSNAMEREMRALMIQEVGKIYNERDEWSKNIKSWNLSKSDEEAEVEKMMEWLERARGQVDGKILTLLEAHTESIKVTLELLKDGSITPDEAINLGD